MENEIVLILLGFIAGAVCFCFALFLSSISNKEDKKKEREGLRELPTMRLPFPDELKKRDEKIERLIKDGWITIVVLRTIIDALPEKSKKEYANDIMQQLSISVGGNVEDMEELIQLSDYHLIRKYIKK